MKALKFLCYEFLMLGGKNIQIPKIDIQHSKTMRHKDPPLDILTGWMKYKWFTEHTLKHTGKLHLYRRCFF